MYNIAFRNVPTSSREIQRLICYDNDWFIKLRLYWPLSILWIISTAVRLLLEAVLPRSGGVRMARTVQWPGYRLSDQDVLTEDRRSVFNTPCTEIGWVHHSHLTNGFREALPPAARSYELSQSGAEVKNAWMDSFTRLYASRTWRNIYLLFILCIPILDYW